MALSVIKIMGIGLHTAKNLKEHGYQFVEELAATTEEALTRVPGFRSSRAKTIIQAAKDLLHSMAETSETPTADAEAKEKNDAPVEPKKKKKKGNKKKSLKKKSRKNTKKEEKKKTKNKKKKGKKKKEKSKGKKK